MIVGLFVIVFGCLFGGVVVVDGCLRIELILVGLIACWCVCLVIVLFVLVFIILDVGNDCCST